MIIVKKTWSLWQYCKVVPATNNNGNTVEFNRANLTDSFNFKAKITGQTGDNGTKEVKIMVPLKYFLILGELLKCLQLIVKLISFWLGLEIVF